jgi:hypothetical protein
LLSALKLHQGGKSLGGGVIALFPLCNVLLELLVPLLQPCNAVLRAGATRMRKDDCMSNPSA